MHSTTDLQYNEFGVPVSVHFDDVYFSVENGLAESRYVFLQHNGLPQRWNSVAEHYDFLIAETGFGTGLNFLATWQSFIEHAPDSLRLHFVSFEKYPLSRQQLRDALAHFPELDEYAEQLIEAYPTPNNGAHRVSFAQHRITLDLWIGDIADCLPEWQQQAQAQVDAWFLDGFAPSKNPQMWSDTLFNALATTAHRDTTVATFTAAGVVKQGLRKAGFEIQKVKGFGRKREMLTATTSDRHQRLKPARKRPRVAVIGDGISAHCCALQLSVRGCPVTLVGQQWGTGASGNPQAAVYPLLHLEPTPLSQFYLQAFSLSRSFYSQFAPSACHWQGVSELNINASKQQRAERLAEAHYVAETVMPESAAQASQFHGCEVAHDGLRHPRAGWLEPQPLLSAMRQAGQHITAIEDRLVNAVPRTAGHGWQLQLQSGKTVDVDYVIIATGAEIQQSLQQFDSKLTIQAPNVRGQVTFIAEQPQLPRSGVLCGKGYLTPSLNGQHCIGATFQRNSDSRECFPADDQENLAQLQQLLAQDVPTSVMGQRASVRNTSANHLPLVGKVPQHQSLYMLAGLGSRGFTSAPLAAEHIACEICGGVMPQTSDMQQRLQAVRAFTLA